VREILNTNYPDLLRSTTLERVTLDVDISLARAGDLEAARAWGRRLAEAVVAVASDHAARTSATSVASPFAPMLSPDEPAVTLPPDADTSKLDALIQQVGPECDAFGKYKLSPSMADRCPGRASSRRPHRGMVHRSSRG
jgi:hypothetical protein